MVNDIESYPKFLDGCIAATILEKSEDQITAKLKLRKAGIEETFVTRNRVVSEKLIEMELVEGPFTKLSGKWQFEPIGEVGCRVLFDLDFQMSSQLLGALSEKLFTSVANTMVAAISQEAHQRFIPNI